MQGLGVSRSNRQVVPSFSGCILSEISLACGVLKMVFCRVFLDLLVPSRWVVNVNDDGSACDERVAIAPSDSIGDIHTSAAQVRYSTPLSCWPQLAYCASPLPSLWEYDHLPSSKKLRRAS